MGNGITRKMCLFALILLVSLTVLTSSIELAEANPLPAPPILEIYIRSDGAVDPPTVPIQRSGNVYTFTNDITNATIEIQRNNTILDGAGYTLQGNGHNWNTAITLTNTNNSLIKNINITNYVNSMSLTNSTNITILNNTMLTSWNLVLEKSENNQIIGNNITGQDTDCGYCIRIIDSSNNLIAANNLKDTGSAIRIGLYSKNNTFHHNNFLNNQNNVFSYIGEDNGEFWSNGKEGNYWSNYEGIDANNDGIGDTPYVIDEKRQDDYPLMAPFDITSINIDIPTPTPTSEPEQSQTALLAAGSLASVLAIGACIIVYFKKYRTKQM
jgi:nitrous oxidase accessory protein NosD